ncbi:Predicted membrane protein [Pyrococcus abyssi GE5]|nr:DUF998 domain-containing protein [Pyrococcus abyssi]CAB49272.1 Predicted membrane protein [Pyrococcus abyssi GE5]
MKKALSIALTLYFILGLALVVHENSWFSFSKNALSDMGSLRNPKGWMFNVFIIGLGLLGLVTSLMLKRKILTLSMAFLVLVGVFPEEKPLHTPSAILTYILAFTDMVIYGGIWRVVGIGTFMVMLFLINLKVGLAIPELIGAASILAYILYLGERA